MTPAQLGQLRQLLIGLARELSGKSPKRIEANRSVAGEVGGAEDEQPLNEMHQAIASNRNKHDAVLSARVDRALGKLREEPESYGLCEECDEEIPFARMKAMPFAELCVACQARRDGPRGGPTRKKITDYR